MDRVAAYKADRADIVALLKDLSEEEWAKPSRCAGWTVQDVVSHMGAAAHGTFGLLIVKLALGKDIEGANDADSAKRKTWAPAKVLKEYENWSRRLPPVQTLLQKPPLRRLPIKVAEVGTYPAYLLTSAFVFDHGLHARHDIAAALGRTMPAQNANALATSVEWMLAGLPAMSADRLGWLDSPVELTLIGDGGGTWTITPGSKRVKVTPGSAGAGAASISGTSADFPVWGTGRRPWREAGVTVSGDEEIGHRFLDTMRII